MDFLMKFCHWKQNGSLKPNIGEEVLQIFFPFFWVIPHLLWLLFL